ncbi:MAG: HutD family protein [Alistipes sp.]|jgi:environmental stress-induced protein Ves|nr:HutD family protein [Alistipes sp.]
MKNTIWLVRKDELAVARWSGGTTTQLAIYPAGASYAERDFVWRVSTATIEEEESVFTPLPGVARVLVILSGMVTLRHDNGSKGDDGDGGGDCGGGDSGRGGCGGRDVALEELVPYGFDGGVPTVSRGRAVDFNLMVVEGKGEGRVEVIRIGEGKVLRIGKGEMRILRRGEDEVGGLRIAEGEVEAMEVDGRAEPERPALIGGGKWGMVSEVYYFLRGGVDAVVGGERMSGKRMSEERTNVARGASFSLGQGDVLQLTAEASRMQNLGLSNTGKGEAIVVRATIRHD